MQTYLFNKDGGSCRASLNFEENTAFVYTGGHIDRYGNWRPGKYIKRKLREDSFSYYVLYLGQIFRKWK